MKSTIFILILFLSTNIFAHREDSYYLSGTFGKQKIAIQIDEFGSSCMATYFYEKDKYDHYFEGLKAADSTFNLVSYAWNESKTERIILEKLDLKEVALDNWVGTFYNREGKEFPVELHPITIDTLAHPFANVLKNYDVSAFYAYRTKDVKLKRLRKNIQPDSMVVLDLMDKKIEDSLVSS